MGNGDNKRMRWGIYDQKENVGNGLGLIVIIEVDLAMQIMEKGENMKIW